MRAQSLLLAFLGAIPLGAIPLAPARADVYVAVSEPPSIVVFAPDAVGDAAPVRTIQGPQTGLTFPAGLTVDQAHGELYVSDFSSNAILVFPLNASGDVAPLRKLVHGVSSNLGHPRQLALDAAHDEILVPSVPLPSKGSISLSTIRVFPRTADGDVAPVRVLNLTQFDNPLGIVLRPTEDELLINSYVAGGFLTAGVLAFSRTATGDAAATRVLAGTATQLTGFTNYLAYDAVHDEIFADAHDEVEAIAVFSASAAGDVAPVRRVGGDDSGLHEILGVAYDPVASRLFVLDSDAESDRYDPPAVHVFERAASGDVVAVMTIAGPHTALGVPHAIAVDARGATGIGPRIHHAAAGFAAALADPAALRAETFDAGKVGTGEVKLCSEPVTGTSEDACFAYGELLGGFAIRSRSGFGIAAVGAGVAGNASPAVGAALTGDVTVITTGTDVTTMSFDVYAQAGAADQGVTVAVFDRSGRMTGFSRVRASAGMPAFVGIVSPTPIARVELASATGAGTALVDKLVATGLAPVPARSPAPEPEPAPPPAPGHGGGCGVTGDNGPGALALALVLGAIASRRARWKSVSADARRFGGV